MSRSDLRYAIRIGLVFGLVALSVSVIGMVVTFNTRDIVTGILTMGQLLVFSVPLAAGYLAGREKGGRVGAAPALLEGFVAGLAASVPLLALLGLTSVWTTIRSSLPNVSPALIQILTLNFESRLTGGLLLAALMAGLGIVGGLIHILPGRVRRPVVTGLLWTLGIGLLSEILLSVMRPFASRSLLRALFGTKGITVQTAAGVFVVTAVLGTLWHDRGRTALANGRAALSPTQQVRARQATLVLGVGLMLLLPSILGTYLTEVLDVVGIFVLMGLGLNIVVGFAGLLDLGYVAFFAIGAYTMGVLTSASSLGVVGLSFWAALPVAVLAAVLAGVLLGVPVLRMRGDYLAIVTLGFGEIIRVLAQSDLLKPFIGGAQGILLIGKPRIGNLQLVSPEEYYYLIVAGALLAAFVSKRLRDARLGRRWMAMREDETVAEAMGVHLVSTKLLAFAIGAGFSGLAGAIFASRISSIFPHSFNLLISINVLCLIIVGGIGSLPGVVLGALVLVGLPELLREFAEYRLLLYGALLIVTMLTRPEGLWPSPITRRELHAADEPEPVPVPVEGSLQPERSTTPGD
jgi:branched-chain amino acid transport system permease protein